MSTTDEIVSLLGKKGTEELTTALKGIKADSKWEKIAVDITIDYVEKYGAKGVEMAWDAIETTMSGGAPDLSDMGIRASSDLLAKLQSNEFKDKSAVEDWFIGLGAALGPLVVAALRGAI